MKSWLQHTFKGYLKMLACFFCFGIGEYLLIMLGGLIAGLFCEKFKLKVKKIPCSCQMAVKPSKSGFGACSSKKRPPNPGCAGRSRFDSTQDTPKKTLAQIRDDLDLKDFQDSF
jgi:hypothetical protein